MPTRHPPPHADFKRHRLRRDQRIQLKHLDEWLQLTDLGITSSNILNKLLVGLDQHQVTFFLLRNLVSGDGDEAEGDGKKETPASAILSFPTDTCGVKADKAATIAKNLEEEEIETTQDLIDLKGTIDNG
ncbi:hypothetical protein TL16_g10155 [Triparma laevis f. inornata]|uniref:Uncharacterized protein n=1 Tax=Triparma laevis f. inornata TaxID=1714386 RepID=A0A9W7B6S8_9STRA|nr:hypothetical protein TL16_g10155 [Triparma laevis f. inornata]